MELMETEGFTDLTSCPHVNDIDKETLIQVHDDFALRQNIKSECRICKRSGPHLWLCLYKDCHKVFCSDSLNHDVFHYKLDERHSVHLNMSNLQLWCHHCEVEIFLTEDLDLVEDQDTRPRGVIGLPNLGNTCYMNSALQALMNSPPLVHYFTSKAIDKQLTTKRREGGSSLSLAFQQLIYCMLTRRTPPPNLLFLIRSAHPMFRGFQQHDSQEFLRCFMDGLHEEMKTTPPDHQCQCSTEEQEESEEEEEEEADDYETCDSDVSGKSSLSISRASTPEDQRKTTPLVPNSPGNVKCKKPTCKSIISEIFDGTLLSSVQCLTCDRVSTRVETFQDLSLPIPSRDHLNLLHQNANSVPQKCSHLYTREQGWYSWFVDWVCSWFWGPTVSLHDCLSAFFSADELKGDNMYSCEKCNKLRNGMKYSKMVKTPEVLCIHLKRFRHDHVFSTKIASHIKFPMEGLDLNPYIHKDSQNGSTKYNLISVICHHGASGSGGHYTCYALNSCTNQWYHYDDMLVTKVSKETVNSCQAYVLFYRRESNKVKKYRTKNRPEAEPKSEMEVDTPNHVQH